MAEPLIELYAFHKTGRFFRDLVGKAICFFTGTSFTHVALYFLGAMWESTVWKEGRKTVNGVRMTVGYRKGDVELYFVTPLDEVQKQRLNLWLTSQVRERTPYNSMKFLVLAIVYPTRWLWKWLKWVPFQADFYGEVCSEFVDHAFKEGAGIDLLPGKLEDYSIPASFLESPYLSCKVVQ